VCRRSFDASVGHFTGALVNMVTKSGTNSLHGNLTYSYYGRPLLTHPFFVNKSLRHHTAPSRSKKSTPFFRPQPSIAIAAA